MEEKEEMREGCRDQISQLEIENEKVIKRKKHLDRMLRKDDEKSFSLEDLDEEIRDHVLDLDISMADKTGFDNFNVKSNLNSTFRSNISDQENTKENEDSKNTT